MPRRKKESREFVSKGAKQQEEILNLPTAEEYKLAAPLHRNDFEAKYRCSKCDGAMWLIAMSFPEIPGERFYQYRCNKCGCIECHNY